MLADKHLTSLRWWHIEHCYQNFLLENKDAVDRELTDATDQIREVLINQHYLSHKVIEICFSFNLACLTDQPEFENMRTLHKALKIKYGSDEEHGAL